MEQLPNTTIAIEKFATNVVKRARFNLNLDGFAGQRRNRKKNASKDLSRSLGYNVAKSNNGFELEFTGNNYANFVEEGRKKGKYVPIAPLEKWIRNKKSMRLFKTNKRGVATFVQMNERSIKSAAIAMSKNIKKAGIKPAPYFGEALNTVWERESDEVQEALVLDLEDIIIKDFLKNPNASAK